MEIRIKPRHVGDQIHVTVRAITDQGVVFRTYAMSKEVGDVCAHAAKCFRMSMRKIGPDPGPVRYQLALPVAGHGGDPDEYS